MVKLYGLSLSPPYRAVYLTCEALGIKVEEVYVDLLAGDHKKIDFLKKNPQHTVPVLEDDDGFVIWDSHAINAYLVGKYGDEKTEHLYPKNLKQRAIVDQRLHFDSGLFAIMRAINILIFFKNQDTVSEDSLDNLHEQLKILDSFLKNNSWLAGGDNFTIADLCTVSTVENINVEFDVSKDKYPNIIMWLERCRNLPFYKKVCSEGLSKMEKLFKSKFPNKF